MIADPPHAEPGLCGRFAPSPTGALHFGSLVAALGSYLSARRRGRRWLVRIEDLDTPRNVAGADDAVLRDLERFAMPWILIQHALGLPTPEYAHLPVAEDAGGHKLGKQSLARPISAETPGAVLVDALDFLGQRPPRELARAPAADVLAWAVAHWELPRVPRRRSAPTPGTG